MVPPAGPILTEIWKNLKLLFISGYTPDLFQ